MSTLRVGTLSNSSGSASVPSDTVISGTAKAWVNFNGTGTVAIRSQFNVSSITDNNTGDYTVNFTNALTDANYCANVTGQTFASGGHQSLDNVFATIYNGTSFSSSSIRVNTNYGNSNSGADFVVVCVSVHR